jgi:purine-binding chemotaxis protein CheW
MPARVISWLLVMTIPDPDQSIADVPILTFSLRGQEYALLVEDVVEVASMVEVVKVADSSPEIVGAISRHGEVLMLIDLRLVMGLEAPPVNVSTLFIVVAHNGRMAGLVVDDVHQVEYISTQQLRNSAASGKYIHGIISYERKLVQIIILDSILDTFLPDKIVNGDWPEMGL